MMEKTIVVPANEADKIEKAMNWREGDDPSLRLGEDETISYTADFGNGMEVDVKVCGVQYEEESTCNSAWAEAVLFRHCSEVCCTEPDDEFFGQWQLEHGGAAYRVNVMKGENYGD